MEGWMDGWMGVSWFGGGCFWFFVLFLNQRSWVLWANVATGVRYSPPSPPPPDDSNCPHSDGTRRKKERVPVVPLACGPPSLLQRVYQSNVTPTPLPHHSPLPLPAPLLFVQPGRITGGRGQDWRPNHTGPTSFHLRLTFLNHPLTELGGGGWLTALKLCKTQIPKEDGGLMRDFDRLLGTTPPPPLLSPPPSHHRRHCSCLERLNWAKHACRDVQTGARVRDAQPYSPPREADSHPPPPPPQAQPDTFFPPQQEECNTRQCINASQVRSFTSAVKIRGGVGVFGRRWEIPGRHPAQPRVRLVCVGGPLVSWPVKSMTFLSSASLLTLSRLNHLIFFFFFTQNWITKKGLSCPYNFTVYNMLIYFSFCCVYKEKKEEEKEKRKRDWKVQGSSFSHRSQTERRSMQQVAGFVSLRTSCIKSHVWGARRNQWGFFKPESFTPESVES